MCGIIADKIQKQYPSFGRREWLIYGAVIAAILAGNLINVIYNVLKYNSADASPVTSVSQVAVGSKFPAFTLGMCFEAIDFDPVKGDAGYVAEDGVKMIDNNGAEINVSYALIDTENLYAECWLAHIPEITMAVPKGQKPSQGKGTDVKPDGFDILVSLTAWDASFGINTSRIRGTIAGLAANSLSFPPDFDFYDFDNQNQIFVPGYKGFLPMSVKESHFYKQDKVVTTFPLSPFQTLNDIPDASVGGFEFRIDGRGLNKVKIVSTEDSTFGLAELFAALLSIFNISLTAFALIFPTQPLVVSQTYFRFKQPTKFDPNKPESLSRPASPGPGSPAPNSPFPTDKENGKEHENEKDKEKEKEKEKKAKPSVGDVALSLIGGDDD
jgi:hypothetical protein